ncbi:MAG: hypothetical protein IJS61_02070 [Firmicutes bacterium]|nr:hypothetical protein [Bacillota bacterium]
MKKNVKVFVSRLLASTMVLSAMFGSVYANAEETVESVVQEVAEDSVETAAAVESDDSSTPLELAELGTPEAGQTYSVDFSTLTDTTSLAGLAFADNMLQFDAGVGAYWHDTQHGAAVIGGDTFKIAVAGNATVTFKQCQYGAAGTFDVTNSKGESVASVDIKAASADGDTVSFDYKGEADTLTVTVNNGNKESYLHAVTIKNANAPVGEAQSFEVWFDDLATDVDGIPTFDQQELTGGIYADTKIKLIGEGTTKFTPNGGNAAFMNLTRAGKTVNAYKAGARNKDANNILTLPDYGDGTALLLSPAANGTAVVYVFAGNIVRIHDFNATTGEKYGYTDTTTPIEYAAFKVEAGHTYVVSTTGKTNNCGFCGVEYTVDEDVDINVEAWSTPAESSYNFSNSTFKLYDAFLGNEAATLDASTTSVKLTKGHSYVVKSDDPAVGATFAATGTDTLKITDDVTSLKLDLVEIPDVQLTGSLITSDGGANDVTSLKFVSPLSGNEAVATIDGNNYSVTLKPGEYQAVIESEKYTTIDRASVLQDEENKDDVYLKALRSEGLFDLPTEVGNGKSNLQFVSANEAAPIKVNNSTSIRASQGDKIVVPVKGGQTVAVAGWYAGTWDINGENSVTATSSNNASHPAVNYYTAAPDATEVTINITGEGANYLYWIYVGDNLEYTPGLTISVPGDFDTFKEANEYIKVLKDRPEGEDGRVTIEMTADVEEQVVFDSPYVTLKGNGHQLSWYYGVGSFYYSIVESTGLYDEELFYDKYSSVEGNGSLWGGVAIIRGNNFIAEDTTFKNTYNYEVTPKEEADFAHASGSLLSERTVGTDVTVYKAKERSNAFYIEADNIEVYNCKILSSQDTFGRNGSANNGYHVYVKDSVIGGNTDYICGEFSAVFDNCELQWKTYAGDASNNSKIGMIVAPKTSPYIFRNCTVTTDGVATDPVTGLYGRTWGQGSNATFFNTETNDHIGQAGDTTIGWSYMSSGDTGSTFYELNNMVNGTVYEGTKASLYPDVVQPAVLPDALVNSYTTDAVVSDVLNEWVPVHYEFTSTFGDSDNDSQVTANDAALSLQYTLKPETLKKGWNDGQYNMILSDVTGDNAITSADATNILQKSLDATYTFPIEAVK